MEADIEQIKKTCATSNEALQSTNKQVNNLLQLQQSCQELTKKQAEQQVQVDANSKAIDQLAAESVRMENPFQFTDHSRIEKTILEGGNLSIKLIEEKQDQKSVKHGAAFEIFTKKEKLMKFDKNKMYQLIFDVAQLKGSADVGILVNNTDEISISNKSKLKRRQNTQDSKIWKLVDQKEIPFKFQEGDRIQLLLTGWIICLNNLTQRQMYSFDIRQEINNNLLDAQFNFSGGLYDQNDCLVFYQ